MCRPRLLALLLLGVVQLAACGRQRPYDTALTAGNRLVNACTGCHGDPARAEADPLVNAAPPLSASGSATAPGVGAHLAHLHGGALRGPVACKECHLVPTSTLHANGQVEVSFAGADFAVRSGATPRFDPATASCSTTYCHGATLGAGGSNQAPSWTGGSPQAACGTCHGAPPPSHAASSTTCAACHPRTVKPDGTIDVTGGFHINGTVEAVGGHPPGWADPAQHGHAANAQGLTGCKGCHGAALDGGSSGVSCASCHGAGWQSNCTWCHGTRTAGWTSARLDLAAPPLGTQGETATTSRAVGAHARHLAGGSIGPALACGECHLVPADLAHLDGTATVTFGAGARRGGASPSWTGVGCSATYCHGGTLAGGGTNKAPSWTGGSPQAACGTCHATPPSTGHHGNHAGRSCGDCHPGFTSSSVNLATHLDGLTQVGNKVTAWNATTRACTGCHGNASW
jgi:predicted CxxxxCH...CXXCH cytochrome family protein